MARIPRTMSVLPYKEGDEAKIAELFDTRAAQREVVDAFDWRYRKGPDAIGPPLVVTGRSEDKVIGFATAIRQDLTIQGAPHFAVQLGTGALGRSSGEVELDAAMVEAVTERAASQGAVYAYVAATERERPFFESLGFDFCFEVYSRNLYIGLEALSSRLSKRALSPFRKFAKEARRIRTKFSGVPMDETSIDQIARLYAEPEAVVEFGVHKSAAYLDWRYRQDPRHDYELLAYKKKAGQGLDAFAVVRRSRSDTGRMVVHVDEQWTRRVGRRTYAKLFGELAMLGLTEESDVLRCFAVAGTSREQALLGLGCIRKKVERSLLVRSLNEDAPALSTPITAKAVQISSGDLDLYTL